MAATELTDPLELEVVVTSSAGTDRAEADSLAAATVAARALVDDARQALLSTQGFRATVTFLLDGQHLLTCTDRELRT